MASNIPYTDKLRYIDLTNANTAFAIDIYKQCSMDDNLFISPFAISINLALTYLRTEKRQKNQIKKVLHLSNLYEDNVHKLFYIFLNHLNTSNDTCKLRIANGLFIDASVEILDKFNTLLNEYYKQGPILINFKYNPDRSVEYINRWASSVTDDKIKRIIDTNSIDSQTLMTLTNIVYFKANWTYEFPRSKEGDFRISSTERVKVGMMCKENHKYLYGTDSDCRVVELPYNGTNLSMFIIIPFSNLREVEEKLTVDHLINVEKRFRMMSININLYLPKFNIDMELNLTQIEIWV